MSLLEAYSRAWGVIQDNSVAHTSCWERQTGATTTAIALAICEPGTVIMAADHRMAVHVTRMICKAFHKEAENVKSGIHEQVWYMTNLHYCMIGRPKPKLVVVDSETAYMKDRDQAISMIRMSRDCPVLVLDGPLAIV